MVRGAWCVVRGAWCVVRGQEWKKLRLFTRGFKTGAESKSLLRQFDPFMLFKHGSAEFAELLIGDQTFSFRIA